MSFSFSITDSNRNHQALKTIMDWSHYTTIVQLSWRELVSDDMIHSSWDGRWKAKPSHCVMCLLSFNNLCICICKNAPTHFGLTVDSMYGWQPFEWLIIAVNYIVIDTVLFLSQEEYLVWYRLHWVMLRRDTFRWSFWFEDQRNDLLIILLKMNEFQFQF